MTSTATIQRTNRRQRRVTIGVGVTAGALALAGTGAAFAGGTGGPAHRDATGQVVPMDMPGMGPASYGMTKAFYRGKALSFTYSKGYRCDLRVPAASTSKCEAGAPWKTAPAKAHDPLYITVPLGFAVPHNRMDCPNGYVCVDHPATIDLSRLEPALKPLYPKLTNAQLTSALKEFRTPGHDHFITDTNRGKPEWWDVRVVGVTNPRTYRAIQAHQSYGYIQRLLKQKNKTVVGPIPTNLFLYFGVQHS